jgi:outer membrane protein assembly factor BamB
MVIDGKVYIGDEDGDVAVLDAAKEKKLVGEYNMGSSVYCTPIAANGVLFIANRNQLIALADTKGKTAMLDLRSLFARR